MSDDTSSQSPPRRRLPLSNIQILLIPILIFGGMLILDFRQRVVEGQEKLVEQEALEAQIARLEAERLELEAQKTYFSSPAFVTDWAHSEGKMVRPGEVLVVPMIEGQPIDLPALPPMAPPSVDEPEQPAETDLSPLSVWWSLFFESSPPLSHP
ncbi:MAG: hypothetical protein ACFB51_01285 [Anaerolineae bacterium]